MKTMNKKILSLILKFLTIVSSVSGIIILMMLPDPFGGAHNLLYFTLQSNIWISVCCLVGVILITIEFIKKINLIKRWMLVCKMVFTICITVTGLVFCFVIAPTIPEFAWIFPNILLHIVVPVFAIVDFFVFDTQMKFEKSDWLWINIPFVYYIALAIIGYVFKWDFGAGQHYPYFFMNFGSKAGLVGFSNELPFMGCVYWLILFAGAVTALTFFYIWLANKVGRKS